jgi:hypothetical protein
MAKSEIRTIYVQHELESRVCRRTNFCETDFAISIKCGQEPIKVLSMNPYVPAQLLDWGGWGNDLTS